METKSNSILVYQDSFHRLLGKEYWRSRHATPSTNHAVLAEWKFEMLLCASLGSIAGSEAQRAAIVVLATDAAAGLPNYIKGWFESWCSSTTITRGTLAVVLNESSDFRLARWPDRDFLQAQSARCGRQMVVFLASHQSVCNDEDLSSPPTRSDPGLVNPFCERA